MQIGKDDLECEPIPLIGAHSPKRHNRLHKINTNVSLYGNKRLPLLHKNNNLWKKRLNSKDADDFLNNLPTKIKDKMKQ